MKDTKNEKVEIVKYGKWSGTWDYICSVCNQSFEYQTAYCPNCGAKMEKGDEDE